jgi:hypothetical protein
VACCSVSYKQFCQLLSIMFVILIRDLRLSNKITQKEPWNSGAVNNPVEEEVKLLLAVP